MVLVSIEIIISYHGRTLPPPDHHHRTLPVRCSYSRASCLASADCFREKAFFPPYLPISFFPTHGILEATNARPSSLSHLAPLLSLEHHCCVLGRRQEVGFFCHHLVTTTPSTSPSSPPPVGCCCCCCCCYCLLLLLLLLLLQRRILELLRSKHPRDGPVRFLTLV